MRLHLAVLRLALLALAVSVTAAPSLSRAQTAPSAVGGRYTRADTLRGSNGVGRAWWDVEFYDLRVAVSPSDSSIRGSNAITYRVLPQAVVKGAELQLDLQTPMVIDSVTQDGARLRVRQDGNAWFVAPAAALRAGERRTITTYFRGAPRVARNPPWDGGFAWKRDSLGQPWIATAVQGLGASAWWPNKDTQADEPDSQRVAITVPDPLVNVSNGRLRRVEHHTNGTTTWEWFVTRPINNYDVAVNAGAYEHFSGVFRGEGGPLTLDFWPMAYHRQAAEQQFRQVPAVLSCFESWFGPYPWYEDGFKLVETPHLGMEHQSAVAYGNRYQNGYLGTDLSGTGLGLLWDFIIVHETAHEWWGNSITTKDLADMWVHEAFANYSESLYTECRLGTAAGARYQIGTRSKVTNDKPIIASYGVNDEGSGDMYYKGGNMLHTMRHVVNDDAKWRAMLRGLQTTFRHRTVTGAEVRAYMSAQAGIELGPVFAQYLGTTKLPTLEWRRDTDGVSVRWVDVVPGFAMPVRLRWGTNGVRITPTSEWQHVTVPEGATGDPRVDENFYVTLRRAQ
ncbi:MAG TPA: M1 family metallopeptidase [Gemmatimonas sp.]|nr:M1 family metallopeptidase [Gemmatimonas sp.]